MALILTRTSQRLTVVHDQDPDVNQTIGKPYPGQFRSEVGQPPSASRITVSPVNADVIERAGTAGGAMEGQALMVDSANVEIDGVSVKCTDLTYGWVLSLATLIQHVSFGPLAVRPSESQSTLPGAEQNPES